MVHGFLHPSLIYVTNDGEAIVSGFGVGEQLLTLVDAAGFDLVILETVGVGQEEVQIKDLAQTTVFVTVPGLVRS